MPAVIRIRRTTRALDEAISSDELEDLLTKTEAAIVAPPPAVPNDVLTHINSWDYQVTDFDTPTLWGHALALYESMDLIDKFSLQPEKLYCLIKRISMIYRDDRPFHNWQHGMSTAQATYYLLSQTTVGSAGLEDWHGLALITAALGHDLDHPGTSNTFQVNAGTSLALKYEGLSVLESHHSSILCHLLTARGSDVFSHLSSESCKMIRSLVVSAILSTDMKVHHGVVTDFEAMTTASRDAPTKWEASSPKEQQLLAHVVLHAADLSNPGRSWPICNAWSARINQEFNEQVEFEKSAGIPFAPYMVTSSPAERGSSEQGFFRFAIQPIWNPMVATFPDLDFVAKNISKNLSNFEAMAEGRSEGNGHSSTPAG